jgi:transposase InsO family protein
VQGPRRPFHHSAGLSDGEFIQNAIAADDAVAPRTIHADRGASMTFNTVTGLLAILGVDQSHSRPPVLPLLQSRALSYRDRDAHIRLVPNHSS